MRKALDYLNMVMMIVMYLIILVQIFSREILNVSTTWSTEFGVILFTLIVLFGTPNITRERMHLKVDALYNLFPKWLKKVMEIVFSLIYIAFFIVMAAGAYRNAVDNWTVDIPTIEWCHLGWIYMLIMIATILIALAFAVNIYEDVRMLRRKE